MTSGLDVGRLKLLREVGVRGSIAAAARVLGLTASAVSQQLATLERETGVALLDRTPRGVVLTGAGRLLADRAEQIVDVLAAAQADLDRATGSLGGTVRVAAVASAAATMVSAAVTTLRADAPAITVAVRALEPERGIGLLLTGDVEIAVVDEYDHVPLALPEGTVIRELAVDPLVLVRPVGAHASPAGRGRVRIADLAGADWVMPPEDAACGRAVRAACRIAGFEPRVRWETDDMLLLATAVADGHGVAVLPRRTVAPGHGLDVRVLGTAREPELSRRLLAAARPSTAGRPVVAAVLDALAAASRQ